MNVNGIVVAVIVISTYIVVRTILVIILISPPSDVIIYIVPSIYIVRCVICIILSNQMLFKLVFEG